ncbi:MAG: DUF1365 domain-containing protein [Pseudohongiellaceae bacterium]
MSKSDHKLRQDHTSGNEVSSKLGNDLESAIYTGFVRHRRFVPRNHSFDNKLFMLLLKTDEIPEVINRFWQLGRGILSWGRFKRQDYIGPTDQPVDVAVRQKMAELADAPIENFSGETFVLCHLRYMGIYFSPLNLYYLKQNGRFTYMLAEVSNTPWNERHYYLLNIDQPEPHAKAFHVSPFNPMSQSYRWRLIPPDPEQARCLVHIESASDDSGEKVFDATLSLQRVPLNQAELTRVLLKTPAQTASVVAGIYWQALKLFIKRVPLYQHPEKQRISSKEGSL